MLRPSPLNTDPTVQPNAAAAAGGEEERDAWGQLHHGLAHPVEWYLRRFRVHFIMKKGPPAAVLLLLHLDQKPDELR
jgi:hypothetical protein